MLWWDAFEFSQFQATASVEIRAFAQDQGIGARAARRQLYQPLPRDILHRERAPSYAEAKQHAPPQGFRRALPLQVPSEPKTQPGRGTPQTHSLGLGQERRDASLPHQQQHKRSLKIPIAIPRPELDDSDIGLPLSPTSPHGSATAAAASRVPAEKKLKGIIRVHSKSLTCDDAREEEEEEEGMYAIDEGGGGEGGSTPALEAVARNIYSETMAHLTNGPDRRCQPTCTSCDFTSPQNASAGASLSTSADDYGQNVSLDEGGEGSEWERMPAQSCPTPGRAALDSTDVDDDTEPYSPPGPHKRLMSHVDSMSLLHDSGCGLPHSAASVKNGQGAEGAGNGNSNSKGTGESTTAGRTPPPSVPDSPDRGKNSSAWKAVPSGSSSGLGAAFLSADDLQRMEASVEEDADLYAIPPMQRINSLDCVKSAQRRPVNVDEDALQEMTDSVKFWDLHRRRKEGGEEGKEFAQAVLAEIDDLTLCVPVVEPGKLRSESQKRVGRFSPRQTSGASDWAPLRVVAWAFMVVAVLVMMWDTGHDVSSVADTVHAAHAAAAADAAVMMEL